MGKMNVILSLDNYSIYMNNNYYLCIPKKKNDFYHLFMGFSTYDLTNLSDDELIDEIRKIGDSINSFYDNGVYILPIIKPEVIKDATLENDDRKYNYLLNDFIQPVTHDVYNLFKKRKKNVSPVIKMIKQNDMDAKIIGWLSMKLGNNYIKEILFDNKEEQTVKPNEILENVFETSSVDTIFVEYRDNKQESYISDTLKPAYSRGFSKLGFILMVLSISSIFGIIIGYMIIK